MAKFYIQLENKLLQISGDLTAENISKALGYVPVSPNVTNELSQRVNNITFDSLGDNPFLQDGSGELNIVDEAGNIIAKIDAEGIHSIDFIAGEHRLTEKADKADVPTKLSELKNDKEYITKSEVPDPDFSSLQGNPFAEDDSGNFTVVDENGKCAADTAILHDFTKIHTFPLIICKHTFIYPDTFLLNSNLRSLLL